MLFSCRHLPCLLKRLARLFRAARPNGSRPTCVWGDVPTPYPRHYSVAFASSVLLYPHLHWSAWVWLFRNDAELNKINTL